MTAESLRVAQNGANGENAPLSPSLPPTSPVEDSPLVKEHARAFKVSIEAQQKKAAFAIGKPREYIDKYSSGQLPTPMLQARRMVERMLAEGQPERAALCELRLFVTALGYELVPLDDWTPTTRQIANKYGATAETKRILEDALTKLFEVGEPFEKSTSYKRGEGTRRKAGRS